MELEQIKEKMSAGEAKGALVEKVCNIAHHVCLCGILDECAESG